MARIMSSGIKFFLSAKKHIYGNDGNVVWYKEPDRPPRESIKCPSRERPQERRWIELKGMRRDVQKNMDKPAPELPDWPAKYEKSYTKNNEKYNCAVADAIEKRGKTKNRQGILRRWFNRIGVWQIRKTHTAKNNVPK